MRPPTSFDALRELLLAKRRKLPKRLEQVLEYVIAHPDDAALGTALSIAGKAKVQPSTVIRFAQALGYPGFADMQEVLKDRLRGRLPNYEERISALRGSTNAPVKAGMLFESFAEASERSIRDLRAHVTPEQLDQAISILAKADTIYLIGQRRSYPVVAYLGYILARLGVRSVLATSPVGIGDEVVNMAGPKDAAIAVSFAPYSPQSLKHTTMAAERGAKLVVITDGPFSPLIKAAHAAFEIVETDFDGFRPLTATLTLCMTLAVAVAGVRKKK